MLSVVMLGVIMLSVIMLSVVMLGVIMQRGIMLKCHCSEGRKAAACAKDQVQTSSQTYIATAISNDRKMFIALTPGSSCGQRYKTFYGRKL